LRKADVLLAWNTPPPGDKPEQAWWKALTALITAPGAPALDDVTLDELNKRLWGGHSGRWGERISFARSCALGRRSELLRSALGLCRRSGVQPAAIAHAVVTFDTCALLTAEVLSQKHNGLPADECCAAVRFARPVFQDGLIPAVVLSELRFQRLGKLPPQLEPHARERRRKEELQAQAACTLRHMEVALRERAPWLRVESQFEAMLSLTAAQAAAGASAQATNDDVVLQTVIRRAQICGGALSVLVTDDVQLLRRTLAAPGVVGVNVKALIKLHNDACLRSAAQSAADLAAPLGGPGHDRPRSPSASPPRLCDVLSSLADAPEPVLETELELECAGGPAEAELVITPFRLLSRRRAGWSIAGKLLSTGC